MLNILWGAMMLIGITYGAMTGRMGEITDAALSSAKEAVVLCITMAGIVAMWMGVMEIARSSGMIEKMTEKMQPLLRFLFPNLPRDHPAMEYISANIIANFLGLGWGATPFGLKAMENAGRIGRGTEAGERTGGRHKFPGKTADTARGGQPAMEMCTFLILNISFPAADPGKYHSIPEPVRKYKPCRHCGAGDCGYAAQHGGGYCFL